MKIDKKCIKRINQGDRNTIEYIYSSYYKLVNYHIYEIVRSNEDADELTQDVFVKAFDKIEQYNSKYAFATWLINIAKHTAIDHLRKKRTDIEYVEDVSLFIADDADSIGGELDEKIKTLLSDEEYTIIAHRVYFDLKFAELAQMLGISTATVTGKYYKAILKLKKELKEEDFYD